MREIDRGDIASGRMIIESIVEAMTAALEELHTKTVAPELFHVYLHDSDYRRLAGLFREIQEEAAIALDQRVASLNSSMVRSPSWILRQLLDRIGPRLWRRPNKSPLSLRGGGERRQIVRPRHGWQVTFHRNDDPEAAPGDIVIDAILMLEPKLEIGAGLTTKSIRTIVRARSTQRFPGGGESSVGTMIFTPANPPGNLEAAAGIDQMMDQRRPDQFSVGAVRETRPSGIRAVLRYHDESGSGTYEMTKSAIVIGRGGSGVWTDIDLKVGTDVSREHLRIREDNGRFFLKDVSTLGTAINGISVPGSMVRSGNGFVDREIWVPLPSPSRITLAGVVEIEFTAREERA